MRGFKKRHTRVGQERVAVVENQVVIALPKKIAAGELMSQRVTLGWIIGNRRGDDADTGKSDGGERKNIHPGNHGE